MKALSGAFGSIRSMQKTPLDFLAVSPACPASKTEHLLVCGDARDLSFIADSSVHLVLTSPPWWTLKRYPPTLGKEPSAGDVPR